MTDHCDSLPNKFKNKKPIAQKSASTLHERLFEKQRHFCFKAPVEVLASKTLLGFWLVHFYCLSFHRRQAHLGHSPSLAAFLRIPAVAGAVKKLPLLAWVRCLPLAIEQNAFLYNLPVPNFDIEGPSKKYDQILFQEGAIDTTSCFATLSDCIAGPQS